MTQADVAQGHNHRSYLGAYIHFPCSDVLALCASISQTRGLWSEVCKTIHFSPYQTIWGTEVTELRHHPSVYIHSAALCHSTLTVAYFPCIWHSVPAQLVSTRTYAVKKHQTQVKVTEGKVSDGGRKGGGSRDWCCAWLLSVYNNHPPPPNKPALTHTHAESPFHPLFL